MTDHDAAQRRGPDRSPSGPREAHDTGSTRFGHRSGSGSNEPKHDEGKDERGFASRQGGDQTADDEAAGGGPSGEEESGSGPAFEPPR